MSTAGHKKLTVNGLASSIVKNSLYFLVLFGIAIAVIFPFTALGDTTFRFELATLYSFSIAGVGTLIRMNSYAKSYYDYQRVRSYIGQMLLFYKYKAVVYLEDVQKWIDSENEKLKARFLKDASFHLGVKQEPDGTIDLKKFFPQEPVKPFPPSKYSRTEKKEEYARAMEQYDKEMNVYKRKMEKFKPTIMQRIIVKKLKEKDYPTIPWKPSAILNVIGDADFYVNKNVFSAQRTHKRATMFVSLGISILVLFFAGGLAIQFDGSGGFAMVIQALFGLFTIGASLIFGGIQGTSGGKKEERSLATANGIFKQIDAEYVKQDIRLGEHEVVNYIRENQIVVITETGELDKLSVDEIAARVAERLNVDEEEPPPTAHDIALQEHLPQGTQYVPHDNAERGEDKNAQQND